MVVAGTPGRAALSRSPVAPGALGRRTLVEVGLRQRGESWCGARPAGDTWSVATCLQPGRARTWQGAGLFPVGSACSGLL